MINNISTDLISMYECNDDYLYYSKELEIYNKDKIIFPQLIIVYFIAGLYFTILYFKKYIYIFNQICCENNDLKINNLELSNKIDLLTSNYIKLKIINTDIETKYDNILKKYNNLNEKFIKLINKTFIDNPIIVETRSYKDMRQENIEIKEYLEEHESELEKYKNLYEKYYKLYNKNKNN